MSLLQQGRSNTEIIRRLLIVSHSSHLKFLKYIFEDLQHLLEDYPSPLISLRGSFPMDSQLEVTDLQQVMDHPIRIQIQQLTATFLPTPFT